MSEEERDHCDIIASVNEKLTAAGFDGLYAPGGECACEVGDIAPCDISEEDGEWINGCRAGYKHIDPRSCALWRLYHQLQKRTAGRVGQLQLRLIVDV